MFCRVFFMILRLPGPTRPATPVPDPSRFRSGAAAAPDLDAALDRARAIASADGVAEVMVIGGTEIYALALPRADRLYVTEVQAEVEGDTWFPALDRVAWREVSRADHAPEGATPEIGRAHV